MKSRTRAAIVILIVGIALWATQDRWLPFLLQNTGFFEKNSGFLSGLEAFVNLALLLFNAGTAYLIWVSKQKGDEKEHNIFISSQSTPTTIPTERLLRSSVPNIGSTLDNGDEWIDNRLRESLDGLLWIDKDCGFDVENYIGLGLQIKSTKVSSLYTVVKINPVDDFLGLESSKQSVKDSRFQEYKSKDIYDIFSKLTDPMVLLGYPGGGKSVTLRHLGQTLSILQKTKKNDNFVLPFYVHLGDYISTQENGLPKPFEDFIIDYICQVWNTPKEVVHKKFLELAQKGKIAFLLDSISRFEQI